MGRVRGIVKRDLRDFCGELSGSVNQFGLVSLMDGRLPQIMILPKNLEDLKGKKMIVSIDFWLEGCKYPVGHIIKIFGNSEDVDVEN